jgi:ribonuclease P protein component
VRTASFEARVSPSLHAFSRVGLVVAKYGRGSVERNLVKRRLREVVRREWLPAWRGAVSLDVLVRTLPASYALDFNALRDELLQLARRIERARPSIESA